MIPNEFCRVPPDRSERFRKWTLLYLRLIAVLHRRRVDGGTEALLRFRWHYWWERKGKER